MDVRRIGWHMVEGLWRLRGPMDRGFLEVFLIQADSRVGTLVLAAVMNGAVAMKVGGEEEAEGGAE